MARLPGSPPAVGENFESSPFSIVNSTIPLPVSLSNTEEFNQFTYWKTKRIRYYRTKAISMKENNNNMQHKRKRKREKEGERGRERQKDVLYLEVPATS